MTSLLQPSIPQPHPAIRSSFHTCPRRPETPEPSQPQAWLGKLSWHTDVTVGPEDKWRDALISPQTQESDPLGTQPLRMSVSKMDVPSRKIHNGAKWRRHLWLGPYCIGRSYVTLVLVGLSARTAPRHSDKRANRSWQKEPRWAWGTVGEGTWSLDGGRAVDLDPWLSDTCFLLGEQIEGQRSLPLGWKVLHIMPSMDWAKANM